MAREDALVYWVGTSEEEIHFIDSILIAYDGIACVRREFKLEDGDSLYKVYVTAGMEKEFLDVMERLRKRASIRSVTKGEDNDETPPTPPSE
ncbi:MAG: DUF4911 domain-containing protein [Candidatus Bipolaricaulota bacterium]|nr:DUF4911 domain-containing protein [Candidatus Bipolaricaulota bacterium]